MRNKFVFIFCSKNKFMVPGEGLEPSKPKGQQIYSLLELPLSEPGILLLYNFWSPDRGSNSGPHPYHGRALPTELSGPSPAILYNFTFSINNLNLLVLFFVCYHSFMSFLTFPEGFLWGAATSAYQVEGNNINADWWCWEEDFVGKPGGPKEKSGIACDSYNRYEEDFDLARSLNHNAHRLSIEWSRIEPQEGYFDEKEIEHYKNVLRAARSRGMSTFVTLWHFTLPLWVRQKGGWKYPQTPYYFARFATLVAKEFGEYIDYFATLNEPLVYLALRHISSIWSQFKSPLQFTQGWIGLIRGHRAAYDAIKSVNSRYKVGFVENVMDMEPRYRGFLNELACNVRKVIEYKTFLFFVVGKSDFIGVNYYFHNVVGPWDFFGKNDTVSSPGEKSDWGWQIYPVGIYRVVKELASYKKPIFISENGLADAKDTRRESFIVRHLYYLRRAIAEGVDVKGYFHWSLLDNFEWAEGYTKKFGLIDVNRDNNLTRKIRQSAYSYAQICKENGISEELLKKFGLA